MSDPPLYESTVNLSNQAYVEFTSREKKQDEIFTVTNPKSLPTSGKSSKIAVDPQRETRNGLSTRLHCAIFFMVIILVIVIASVLGVHFLTQEKGDHAKADVSQQVDESTKTPPSVICPYLEEGKASSISFDSPTVKTFDNIDDVSIQYTLPSGEVIGIFPATVSPHKLRNLNEELTVVTVTASDGVHVAECKFTYFHSVGSPVHTPVPPSPPVSGSGCTSCPIGWTKFESRCYKFYGAKITGSQAEQNCNKFSSSDGTLAHLASINSAEEQDFVLNLWQDSRIPHTPDDINMNTMNSLWIGGKKTGNTWGWTDGSAWSYSQWDRTYGRQPDGSGSCAHMWTHSRVQPAGSWNDVWCDNNTYRSSYVCELPSQSCPWE